MDANPSWIDWGSQIAPIVIAFVVVVGAVLTIIGWYQNRKLHKESASLRLLLDYEKSYSADFRGVYLIITEKEDLRELARSLPVGNPRLTWEKRILTENLPTNQKKYACITNCLTYYEAIAIAIHEGSVDERSIKAKIGPKLCFYVRSLYQFIEELRDMSRAADATVYAEVEKLARRWGADLPGRESILFYQTIGNMPLFGP